MSSNPELPFSFVQAEDHLDILYQDEVTLTLDPPQAAAFLLRLDGLNTLQGQRLMANLTGIPLPKELDQGAGLEDLLGQNGEEEPAAEEFGSLAEKLEAEVGDIAWIELRRFFAMGKAVKVDPDMDLVEVGMAMAEDNEAQVKDWAEAGTVMPVDDATAEAWFAKDITVKALVIRPWVLVQAK